MLRSFCFAVTLIAVNLMASSVSANTNLQETQVMKASWYGPGMKLHTLPDGRRVPLMANGEEFDMNDPTVVAHKTLPLGTELKITNPENGWVAYVTVQDRGPYVKGRDIDLAKGVAKKIGFDGVGPVEVEIISLPEQ